MMRKSWILLLLLWLDLDLDLVAEAADQISHKHPLPVVPYDKSSSSSSNESSKSRNHQPDKSQRQQKHLLQELNDFAENAVRYLTQISHTSDQDPDFPGRFTYRADLRKNLDPTLQRGFWKERDQPDYNLLRHSGAIYALGEAYRRYEHQKESGSTTSTSTSTSNTSRERNQRKVLAAMERAVGYLRDNALLPVPDHKDEWVAAWERIDVSDPHSEPDVAKLGGCGLSIIAMVQLESIKPNSVSMDNELRKLGAFVEALQNPKTGGFTCKYQWGIGPYDEWVSLYYPGEAALSMALLAELELSLEQASDMQVQLQHDTDRRRKPPYSKRWLKVATRSLLYLERLRRDIQLEDVEPDHWALLATARLLPRLDEQRAELEPTGQEKKQADLEYSLIYNHGLKVANAILVDHTSEELKKQGGRFNPEGGTCPTATRLEGLLAALTFIRDDEIYFGNEREPQGTELIRDRIERDTALGFRLLIKAQQTNDRNGMRGAVPGMLDDENPFLPATQNTYDDVINDDEQREEKDPDYEYAEVRVDYVQHSLSAVMAYEAFLLDKNGSRSGNHNGGMKKFHEKLRGKVDKVVHHVRHKINTASESAINYSILGAVCWFVTMVIGLAYLPWSWIPILGQIGRKKRRRKIKRND